MAGVDLPFLAEYAKSNRASCKSCKGNIAKDSLRLAVMVQSPRYDGRMPNWFHYACFFGKNRIKTTADIENFDQLRYEDQKKIKEKIIQHGAGGVQAGAGADDAALKDFQVEIAKSSRSGCKGCEAKISKGAIRIAKKDYESDSAKRFGPLDRWYHLQCFVNLRDSLEFFAGGDVIPGFKSLSAEEQAMVKEKLPELSSKGNKRPADITEEVSPTKKPKSNSKEEKQLREQSQLIYDYRDKLQKELTKKELQLLLEHNNQHIPSGESKILDRLADAMAFGSLLPCPECKDGQLALDSGGYRCHGNLTEWTKCSYFTTSPKRKPFKVLEDLTENVPFLKKYKFVARERLFPSVKEKPSVSNQGDKPDGSILSSLPLRNMKFVIGKTNQPRNDISKVIGNLGGMVVSKLDETVLAYITSPEEVAKKTSRITDAKKAHVQVVSEDIVELLKDVKTDVAKVIKEKSLCDWGGDITDKVKLSGKKDSSNSSTKSMQSIKKMTMKGSSPVDPDSGLEDVAHVLEEGRNKYTAVLGLVDVVKGTNSYYRLQLLESDEPATGRKKYWVFRAWGRIGTTIGGTKVEKMTDKESAVEMFESLYEEKTGNTWGDELVKYPNRFYPMELDYKDDTITPLKDIKSKTPSKLHQAVQDLVCMIFDVETMKKVLIEFEIDLNKMPLGKLSRRQIESAYSLLTELQEIIESGGAESKFLDASNRFYTLIPHDFGLQKPPLLNNEEIIKSKLEMLDSLLEIEIAYNLLKGTEDTDENPVDSHYNKLNANIEVLDKDSDEFSLLSDYVKNTHASTHTTYSLEIEEVFKVCRKGEDARYKPFKKLDNRMLLWHGSRLTNFAGILSQGLRIAPPEAPVTGYMFGKGLYFADMVSKSANYCFASRHCPTGLLLLCEVALGKMHERTRAEFVTKLPPGKHSTKGVGQTYPDPSQQLVTKEGVTIPLGKPMTAQNVKSALLYNEYIVYDVAQVNVKYLLQLKFNWKV